MEFNERLRLLRVEKRISQARLAEALGVVQQTIGKWEKGIASPDPAMIVKISDYFNVTTDYLLGRTDNPAPVPQKDEGAQVNIPRPKRLIVEEEYILESLPETYEEFYEAVSKIVDRKIAEGK